MQCLSRLVDRGWPVDSHECLGVDLESHALSALNGLLDDHRVRCVERAPLDGQSAGGSEGAAVLVRLLASVKAAGIRASAELRQSRRGDRVLLLRDADSGGAAMHACYVHCSEAIEEWSDDERAR